MYDPKAQTCRDLGPVFDRRLGRGAAKVHILVEAGQGRLYAGENDNTLRSSYLWECHIAS
ncbi:MAG TPA: hypothetical protein PLB78_20040 [Anaerolineae bacterium]|nr:hypothetical protein [Anaerolineae bacterium]